MFSLFFNNKKQALTAMLPTGINGQFLPVATGRFMGMNMAG
jgi:hypothetical protein